MTDRQSARLKKQFLEHFAGTGNITESATAVGIRRRVVYEWQERDDEFCLAFREAEIQATETMEAEARRRGMLGVDEPVFHQGEVVGSIKKYSDTLLIFLLKARAPEKYRERLQMQHADADGKRLPLGAVEEFVKDALGNRA